MLLHHKFIQSAKENPKKLAIIDKSTNKDITFEKALIASLILAKRFKKYPDKFIGIMLPTSAGCALASAATLMSGKVPAMINYSTGAEANARYAQQKCSFTTIITSSTLLEKIKCPKIEGMVIIEEIMDSIGTFEKLQAALISKLPLKRVLAKVAQGKEDDTATILFTSGSEKEPKAVQLTHKNLISNIVNFSSWVGITPDDKLLANLVFFHVFGLTANLWLSLYQGMTMITYANPLDFQAISNIAREEKPTVMLGTPSFFWGYLSKSKKGDFKSIRLMVAGADKCPDALREGFLKKHGVTLLEGYGATETSPVVSTNSLEFNRPGSIGKPIPGVQVKIIDVESGKECETGSTGVIYVKGDLVMKGYYNDPELTAEVLKDGWYNTGDMGYLDADGYLWHSGRLKRFVKIGGEMVSLIRVEDVLEKVLPEGVSCCVVDLYDQKKGSIIVAAVTKEVNKSQMTKELAKELPNIAIPKHFVVVENLPMMGTGKVDFRTTAKVVEELLTDY